MRGVWLRFPPRQPGRRCEQTVLFSFSNCRAVPDRYHCLGGKGGRERINNLFPRIMTTRILHFIDTLGAGGAERQLVYLLEGLDRRKYESHVLTTYDKFRHYESVLQEYNVPIYSLHHGVLNIGNRAVALSQYVRLMWQLRPAIVHSWLHYPNLISRLARPLCPPHKLATAIRSRYSTRQLRSERLTFRLSDFRIVNWPDNQLLNQSPADSLTKYIKNGIANEFFNITKPYSKTQFIALIPARIDPLKGHITLLTALSLLRDRIPSNFTLRIIGELTDPDTQIHINDTIDRYHLHGLVEQLPVTSQIALHYQQARVTLVPSFSEGSSNVILESLASGTPVIASQAANQANLVQHNRNGWVFPTGNAAALAQCLETATQTSPQNYIEMAAASRESVTEFTIEHMISEHEAVYEYLIKRA